MSDKLGNIELKPTEQNIELIGSGGLKCDNVKCDYFNETIEIKDYEHWINKPCPKCSENLLTLEDFNNVTQLLAVKDFINGFTKEELENALKPLQEINKTDPNKRVKVTFNTHKKISVDKIEDCD